MERPHNDYTKKATECRASGQPNFDIQNVRRQFNKPTLAAHFDVVIPGAVIRNCRLHISRKDERYIGMPGHLRNGQWQDTVDLDPDLKGDILQAVLDRLAADEEGGEAC